MPFDVFIENEAGASQKNHHNERTLSLTHAEAVSRPYPYPYGFIIGTRNADGDCLDCFVITAQSLRTGTIVQCEAIGLMEQTESGLADNNILARLMDDQREVTSAVRDTLSDFVQNVFRHLPDRAITVGRFLPAQSAEAEITRSRLGPDELLHVGMPTVSKTGQVIVYRYVQPSDDAESITALLHVAYGALAARGMNFVAARQNSAMTKRRMARGNTILAIDGTTIIGTITLKHAGNTHGCDFYEQPDVAGFGQFAVNPSHQKSGIGGTLLSLVEQSARQKGVKTLALDTSEHATDLISFYEAKGYRFVQYMQWPETNYRSVVLAKPLT